MAALQLPKNNVLVKECNPAVLEMIERALELAGYTPIAVTTDQEARSVLERTPDLAYLPAAILLDAFLPSKQVPPLLAYLRERRSRFPLLPVVLLTTDMRFTVSHAAALGISGVLHKPFHIRALLDMTHALVEEEVSGTP